MVSVLNMKEQMKAYVKIVYSKYKDNYRLVCPTCCMFGSHKTHEILPLSEGSNYLKESIQTEQKKGIGLMLIILIGHLERSYFEKQISEVIEYRDKIKVYEEESIKRITDVFDIIINNIIKRKNELLSFTYDLYGEEKDKLTQEEDRMYQNIEKAKELMKYIEEGNKENALKDAQKILETIKIISKPLNYTKAKAYTDIDTNLRVIKIPERRFNLGGTPNNQPKLPKVTLTPEEIVQSFQSFCNLTGQIQIEYTNKK